MRALVKSARNEMQALLESTRDDTGAVGYILAWLLGVPASVLFLIFLMRGCN